MTTSDDEPVYVDNSDSTTTHADPLGDDLDAGAGAGAAAGPSAGRLLLAVLAALAAAALGVVAWSYVFIQFDREYVGISVFIGLAVGWLLRVVSGRASVPVRVLAVVITAIACVLGTATAELAQFANEAGAQFGPLYRTGIGDAIGRVPERPALTLAIFVAALVLAYLSAAPQKPAKSKKRKGADPEPVTAGGYVGDDGYDADAARHADDDDAPPPPPPAH